MKFEVPKKCVHNYGILKIITHGEHSLKKLTT